MIHMQHVVQVIVDLTLGLSLPYKKQTLVLSVYSVPALAIALFLTKDEHATLDAMCNLGRKFHPCSHFYDEIYE